MGFGHIGQFAIGFIQDSASSPLVLKKVSRIIAGGFSNGRPTEVAALGVDLLWDNGDYIIWDDEQTIGWEA